MNEVQAVDLVTPRCSVFDAWWRKEWNCEPNFDAGLLWVPQGMGALQVENPPYDASYFQNYQHLAMTDMGVKINELRTELVRTYVGGATHVLDVGIGSGSFILSRGGWTWGYDVNPVGVAWLRETGRFKDPYEKPFPVVTLWDVLEHIPEPKKLLDNVGQWLFTTLPIVPGDGPPASDWRHYKPREHCWYWTRAGVISWMAEHGFACREVNTRESALGRLDSESFAFERVR